ncbi:MAG: hypothetical protein LBR95_02565 [Azoarcus sp.]|jgi:hypothetical protein|nr:hypothetical protein [Azoarcus sp.]
MSNIAGAWERVGHRPEGRGFATSANGRSLEISILGTNDKVMATDCFLAPCRQIEHISAGDFELDAMEVKALILP